MFFCYFFVCWLEFIVGQGIIVEKNSSFDDILISPYTEFELKSILPLVCILPLPPIYNIHCNGYKYGNSNVLLGEHNHDHIIHDWLRKYAVHNSTKCGLYYLPFYIRDCYESEKRSNIPWNGREDFLKSYINSDNEYSSDKTFYSATFPLDVPNIEKMKKSRFLVNLRSLRVDNALTINGRDVMVPYYVKSSNFVPSILSSEFEMYRNGSKREKFLFAPCKNAMAKMDASRRWREKAYEYLQNTSNSIVTLDMTEPEFIAAMKSSDFCFVFPGDTVSTAKLFKAIFAGCVPVVFISSRELLPFARFLYWERFSILVRKEDLGFKRRMDELLQHLQRLRESRQHMASFRFHLQQARLVLDWDRSQWPSVFHLLLLELVLSDGRCGDCSAAGGMECIG
mmetsp:Transcript_12880/g.19365  ORF Transcript_12880/g.19365 Transcript_12880/m.19365 type:complete len:396 (+) Transcript_12880:96-1283(+)